MKTSFLQALLDLQQLFLQYDRLANSVNKEVPQEYKMLSIELKQVLIHKIDDDALYELWKNYGKCCKEWNDKVAPKLNEATKIAKASELLFKEALGCLETIIAAAKGFITAYEGHKEKIVGEVMQKKFQDWAKTTQEALDHPKNGWLFLRQYVTKEYQVFQEQQAIVAQLDKKIKSHREQLKIWKERVLPNINALLVEQQDVDRVKAMVKNLQELLQILQNAPKNIQGLYLKWKELAEKDTWKKRMLHTQKTFERTQNRFSSKLINGNPELAAKGYTYEQPTKKEKLYQRGKKDQHEIAANDVQQGDLDNCFLLSPIAALAQNNPDDLKKLIKEKADGSFEVTLYLRTDPNSDKRTATTIAVKNEFVRDGKKAAYAGKGDNELWVQVLEKAYAQAMGGYDAIAKGGAAVEILQVLTGKTATKGKITKAGQKDLFQLFQEAIKTKTVVTLTSCPKPSKKENSIILNNKQVLTCNHVYYLDKINEQEIYLKNPHGKDHLTLDWDTFFNYFIDYAKL